LGGGVLVVLSHTVAAAEESEEAMVQDSETILIISHMEDSINVAIIAVRTCLDAISTFHEAETRQDGP
jgi:hypothetical protein